MKKIAALMVGVFAFVAMVAMPLYAQDAPAAQTGVKVVLTGTNYCVACALKEQGAQAACDADHQHALKVTDVKDEAGVEVKGIKGKTLFYLANAKGQELEGAQALHGKNLKVEGTLFKDERIVDVAKYEEIPG